MFDVEILVPMCGKFMQRVRDFKKYGLVNIGSRSVLVNLVLSNENIEGIESGWPEGVVVNVVHNDHPGHVANLYRFYTTLDPNKLKARWLVRLDDDSCTDIDRLVANLDKHYDPESPVYLGDLNFFHAALGGGEHVPLSHYKSMVSEFEPFLGIMQNEIECGIMSAPAVAKMMRNMRSRDLLKKRCQLEGGFGDCMVAIAAALAGVWPINCPFLTHLPMVHEFSIFGGFRNHIHQISRIPEGENFFGRPSSPDSFKLLTKAIDNQPTEIEKSLFDKRFLMESPNSVRIIEFQKGYVAKIKLEETRCNWFEQDGRIIMLTDNSLSHRFDVESPGVLSCRGYSIKEI